MEFTDVTKFTKLTSECGKTSFDTSFLGDTLMARSLKPMTPSPPCVTPADMRRFTGAVEILDAKAFAAELEAFVRERVVAVSISKPLPESPDVAAPSPNLRAAKRWIPTGTDIQRGRKALVEEFNRIHNVSLAAYAKLAGKSRQQIYKDIAARRLLAVNIGSRGQKLPDWQLDPAKGELTRYVLARSDDVDSWTVYHALTQPLESLGGASPIDAVAADSLDAVTLAVCNSLGVH